LVKVSEVLFCRKAQVLKEGCIVEHGVADRALLQMRCRLGMYKSEVRGREVVEHAATKAPKIGCVRRILGGKVILDV
jgi:hypothetical protein